MRIVEIIPDKSPTYLHELSPGTVFEIERHKDNGMYILLDVPNKNDIEGMNFDSDSSDFGYCVRLEDNALVAVLVSVEVTPYEDASIHVIKELIK